MRLVALCLAAALGAPIEADVSRQLEEARLAIRRGDLTVAERTLDAIDRSDASERELALLELYEGNADFWRLDYEEAGTHYEAARIGFAQLDERSPGSEQHVLEVIDENIAQVRAELARSARLERDAGRVVTWLVVVAVLATTAVALLVRSSRLR